MEYNQEINLMKDEGYKRRKRKRLINSTIRYTLLTITAILLLYPIVWMIGATTKTNSEIFTSISFLPKRIDFSPFVRGWKTSTEYTFATYFANTFKILIPKVIFTVISSTLTAYGFARYNFKFKKPLFAILIATLFLPNVVTRIPLYLLWRQVNLLDTYVPLIAGTLFASEAFFVFMLVQFMRSIPRDLDEAATVDGCGPLQILIRILIPILKPALISVGLFQFMWSMNDFLGPLIYITSVEKYPVAIALKMAMDTTSGSFQWNQIIAMSLIGLFPSIALFFAAQKHFVEGMASSGIKG